jgi:hypothetical protein
VSSFKPGDLVVLISKKRSKKNKAGKYIPKKQPGLLLERVVIEDTRNWYQGKQGGPKVPGPGWKIATADDGVVTWQEKSIRLQGTTPGYVADMIQAHEALGRKIEEWKIENLATL